MEGPDSITRSLKFGPYEESGTWQFNDEEKKAAWEMYIELITRISVQELKTDEGLLREALSSFYSLFGITRDILKKYGPRVAVRKHDGSPCFAFLALTILNDYLRPFLTKWHPLLQDYEDSRENSVSRVEHEEKWSCKDELSKEINENREKLMEYASLLADLAGIPHIHEIRTRALRED